MIIYYLLIINCWLFIIYWLLIVYYLLLIVNCWLLIIDYLLFLIIYCWLLIVVCQLSIVNCQMLFAVPIISKFTDRTNGTCQSPRIPGIGWSYFGADPEEGYRQARQLTVIMKNCEFLIWWWSIILYVYFSPLLCSLSWKLLWLTLMWRLLHSSQAPWKWCLVLSTR